MPSFHNLFYINAKSWKYKQTKKTSKNRNELYIYSGVPNRVKNISEIQNCPLLFICFSSLFFFLSLSLLFSFLLLSLGSAIGYRALVDGSWDLGRSGTCYRTSSQLTIGGPAKPISSTWIHSCASASVRRRRVASARWPPPIIFHPANRSFQSGPTRRTRGGERRRRRRNAVPRVNPLFRRILRGPRRSTESSSPNRVARKRPN